MTYLLLHTFLLLLAAYFLGAFIGCTAKRLLRGTLALDREGVAAAGVPISAPAPIPQFEIPQPIQRRAEIIPELPRTAPPPPRPVLPPVAAPTPRTMPRSDGGPIQPMIETGRRPEIRSAKPLADPSRFERALFGPDPNENMPRIPVVQIMPAVFDFPTGPPLPWPPPPKPEPVAPPLPPEPVADAVDDPVGAAIAEAGKSAAATAGVIAEAATSAASKSASAASSIFSRAREAVSSAAKSFASRKATDGADKAVDATNAADEELADREAASAPSGDAPATAEPPPKPKPLHKFDTSGGDDFQRIRAIDAETERRLKEVGVAMFDTIAAWTSADVNRINQLLGFTDRIDREQWIEQAQILAKGGETYYSRNRATALKSAAQAAEAPAPKPASAPVTPPVKPPAPTKAEEKTASSAPPAFSSSSSAAPRGDGKSVAEMASAAAAAIAAASASVTRGLKPIEPISPLSKVDPNIAIPARLADAIKERSAAAARELPAESASDITDVAFDPEDGDADDLKRIRGIGVLIEKRLFALGITRYEHIANWTSSDIERVSQVLDFKGRIEREGWVEQARILSTGGDTEFSRRVDRGEVDSSRES